jgi:hypothetical protein
VRKLTLAQIPELPGYIPVARIAADYGVHKGTIYYMIYHQAAFRHVYKVSTGMDDPRPLIVILESEVREVFAARERKAKEIRQLTPAQQVQQWNRRVKQWGRDIGWEKTPILLSGPPSVPLVTAYLEEHADDPRPE